MPVPFRLDHVIERLHIELREASALQQLAGVRLSAGAARAAWPRVLEHKWYMSERMGRDVGLRVAAVDYFDNVYREERFPERQGLSPWLAAHPGTA